MTESNSWITDDQFTELEKYDKEWAKMLRVGKFDMTRYKTDIQEFKTY